MRKVSMLMVALALLAGAAGTRAWETPKMPSPQKEHEWLKQFAGEWETQAEAVMEPGKPPMKFKGTDSTRLLGGFWMVSEIKSDAVGAQVNGLMTIGYDSGKKKYVGTWVCSMDGHLWKYEGSHDGKALTLNTEGPSPSGPGKMCKMRDVIELIDKDNKLLTSYMLTEDGKWVKFMTITAKRKK